MSFRLTDDEAWAFVSRAHTGILTTLRRDGRPVTLPVWHVAHHGSVYIRTPVGTAKVKRIRHDPRASFLVESGQAWAELMAVSFAAIATIEPDADTIALMLKLIAEKYAGAKPPLERLPAKVADLYQGEQLVLRLDPVGRLSTWNNAGLLS